MSLILAVTSAAAEKAMVETTRRVRKVDFIGGIYDWRENRPLPINCNPQTAQTKPPKRPRRITVSAKPSCVSRLAEKRQRPMLNAQGPTFNSKQQGSFFKSWRLSVGRWTCR